MSEKGTFYQPGELDLAEVIQPYQNAFKGWPWYEVSKCEDQETPQRCASGLSPVDIGSTCNTCTQRLTRPAYESDELLEKFQSIEATRQTRWYAEKIGNKMATIALAWLATPRSIAAEKYSGVPEMQNWLENRLPESPIAWLDEVFADDSVRASGNLKNFGTMCRGFMDELNTPTLAYRTISPAMVRVAERDFAVTPEMNVPDRRSFVLIEGER